MLSREFCLLDAGLSELRTLLRRAAESPMRLQQKRVERCLCIFSVVKCTVKRILLACIVN